MPAPSSRRPAAPPPKAASARRPTPQPVGETARPSTRRTATQPGGKGSSRWPLIAAGVAGVAIIALLIVWGPMQRARVLGELDACGAAPASPDRDRQAVEIADRFLALVGPGSDHARAAVAAGRGPFAAQLRMALAMRDPELLLELAQRPARSPAELAEAVGALVAQWPADAGKRPRLPGKFKQQVRDPQFPAAAAAAVLKLVATAAEDDSAEILGGAGGDAALPEETRRAAIAGLASVLMEPGQGRRIGYALRLASGPQRAIALGDEALRQAITASVRSEHLPLLLPLVDHADAAVRALALSAIGGPNMTAPAGEAGAKLRRELTDKLAARLVVENDPREVEGTLKALCQLRLDGARDRVLAIAGETAFLQQGKIGTELLATCLARAFMADGGSDEARKRNEELVGLLAKAVDDPQRRAVAAAGLALVTDSGLLALREGVDALARNGADPDCLRTLIKVVGDAYGRDDVVRQAGASAKGWQELLAKDRPRFDRYREIGLWMLENGQYVRVSDGRARLGRCREFLKKAAVDIDGWLEDPSFVAPIGLGKGDIQTLSTRLKMQIKSVNHAWSGALD